MLPNGRDSLILRFGDCQFDVRTSELSRAGQSVKLQLQPAKVLGLLASHPGELLSREEIRAHLWGSETHVDFEQGLNYAIKQIRLALNDDADAPRYIETLPRRGYRFVAPVTTVTEGADDGPPALGRRFPRGWRSAYFLVALLVVLFGLAGAIMYLTSPRFLAPRLTHGGRILLAVLPLQNLDDQTQDYLSDGLTEELITQLGRVNPNSLGVIARTSVLKYKNTVGSVREIGRELAVDYILEGSTRQAGGRVRLNVQLIRVSDQTHLWAEAFERDTADILRLEAELARTVAREITVKLVPGQWSDLAPRRVNPLARDAYLRGRHYSRTLSGAGVAKAIGYFEKAISIDPDYAPAHAGLADCYYSLSNMRMAPAEAMKKARQAAERALALDPMLAEAHLSLGLVHAFYEWDWAGGEKEFKAAIDLQPGLSDASVWYGIFLALMGRFDESLTELKRANEIDPLRADVVSAMALPPYLAGRYDEALRYGQRALELDPNFYMAQIGIGTTYEAMGKYPEAIAAFQRARLLDDAPVILAFLGRTYAKSGNRQESLKVLSDLRRLSASRHVSAYDLALLYEGLGLRAQALEQLQRGYETRAEGMVSLRVDPRMRNLHTDPAFQHLLQSMRFP